MNNTHKVPVIWDAALEFLRHDLDRVMWNIHQEIYNNPFGNTGNKFKCDAFEVEAYDWDDEHDRSDSQLYNFKWRDVEISWYKYLGRGMHSNKELTPDLAAEMLEECLACLAKYEEENGNS